jgi:hypothetical protein
MSPENRLRADRILCAATAVEAYQDSREEPNQLAADLLADLRHFCDLQGLQFDEVNAQGHGAYLSELEDPET